MKYLLNVTEQWRVDTVEEALAMRDEFANAPEYELNSFAYDTKFDKKTEEEYQIVKVKKTINTVKNPTSNVKVGYGFDY